MTFRQAIRAAKQHDCDHVHLKNKRFSIGKPLHFIDAQECKDCGLINAQKVIEPPPIHSGIPWGTEENFV